MASAVGNRGFNVQALFAALEDRREAQGLSWSAIAELMWAESAVLNARRGDHPLDPSTITSMPARGDASCQHALIMLRWLGDPPEAFIAEPAPGTAGVPLPVADEAHRLRWKLSALYDAVDAARSERGATWTQTAAALHCTARQLTGLRTAQFAMSMRLAMRICQALRRPSADFIHAAEW